MASERSIFDCDQPPDKAESFCTFLEHKNVTIERIVSSGNQPSAKYLQDHDEWVILISGEAEMTLGGEPVLLKAGDTLQLPGGVEHEVLRTSVGAVWLAVHIR
jgi:cupin 2 domain-containing protein